MYFAGDAGALDGEIRAFVERLSDYLEDVDLSLLDRAGAALSRDGDALQIDLPHRERSDFSLRLRLGRRSCAAYFGRAHVHFEGARWADQAFGFVQALSMGNVAVRALLCGGETAAAWVYNVNGRDEWIFKQLILCRVHPLGRWSVEVNRLGFAAPEDFERIHVKRAAEREAGQEGEPLEGNPYFRRVPAGLTQDMRRFFDELCLRLEKLRPPLLDERASTAYLVRDEGGDYLCIKLAHKREKTLYVGADVYDGRCDLYYGNGAMTLQGDDWFQESFGFLGAIVMGLVGVESHYRGGRLVKVVQLFYFDGDKPLKWVQRKGYKVLGRSRVEVRRVNFLE